MAVAELAMVVATILSADGSDAAVDRGALDGLDLEDRGAVYYALIVRGDEKRIDVGSAEIISVDDPFVEDQIRKIEAAMVSEEEEGPEDQNLGYFIAAPTHYLERDDLEMASDYVERAEALEAEHPDVEGARRAIFERQERDRRSQATAEMAQLSRASYSIGLDISDAAFLNQQPRHDVRLEEFRIDREAVSTVAFKSLRPDARTPRNGVPPHHTGVSFADAQAYCSAHPKRLPSEQEWEVAAGEGLLSAPPGLNEWTASWYRAYPGNDRPQDAFGEAHRVLRRLRDDKPRAHFKRRFLALDQSHPSVEFRCVSNGF